MSYDQAQANRALNFFERILKHSGEWYGDPFMLAPWQEEALSKIFGTLDTEGKRQIDTAYLEIVKKSGKTEFVAGLALLFLVLDEARGCEVYGAASTQRQALNVYRAATAMVEQSDILSDRLRILRSTHRIQKRSDPNSFYAAIAADGDFSDGVNPKFVIADELHRWRTRKQLENWDVLRLGGVSRKSIPLTVAITTAGIRNESPLAWRLHEKALKQQQGLIHDPSFYGRVYAAEPEDDWTSEKTWIKANPSLKENGGFLELARIRKEYESSLSDTESQRAFKRYYLNLWGEKENRSIDMQEWDACQVACDWTAAGLLPKPPEDTVRPISNDLLYRFIERQCWLGVDLSFTTDMSAVVAVFPPADRGGDWDVLPFFWMPEWNIRKREIKDGMPYRSWAEQGFIELCPDRFIDNGSIKERIKWCARVFDVRQICFDRYNSREISTDLVTQGYSCIEVPQLFNLSEATKKLLTLVTAGKLKHGGNPVLRWNASCLTTKGDGNDNVRPVKPERDKSVTRIDGLSAAITAMFCALPAQQVTSAYEQLGTQIVI